MSRTGFLHNMRDERVEPSTSAFTWFLESFDGPPPVAVAGYSQYSLYSAVLSDPENMCYDENGDLIVAENGAGSARGGVYPSRVLKIRRPKSGISGGDVEWVQTVDGKGSAQMSVYYDKYLKQAILFYNTNIYILDSQGNIIRTITPSFTWNQNSYITGSYPQAVFFNDSQILLTNQANGTIYIMNMDGSVAWSLSGFNLPLSVTRKLVLEYGLASIAILDRNAQAAYQISWDAQDQYTLPPSSASPSLISYFPNPRSIVPYKGGAWLIADNVDSNTAFGYIHWVYDTPNFSIPLAVTNSIDMHPYLNRIVMSHKDSIFEIDLDRALASNPFKESYSNLYYGQPSTSASTLAWTYTKRLNSVYLHFYNNMNVNASVSIYYMYPYNTGAQVREQPPVLITLTPPPTPVQTLTVSAGTSADVSITDPPMAVLIQGASASTPSSGNLIITAEGYTL